MCVWVWLWLWLVVQSQVNELAAVQGVSLKPQTVKVKVKARAQGSNWLPGFAGATALQIRPRQRLRQSCCCCCDCCCWFLQSE